MSGSVSTTAAASTRRRRGSVQSRPSAAPVRRGQAHDGSVSYVAAPHEAEERGRAGVDEIQRVRMLRAMIQVAAERGAPHVTVGHVVDRAGVSRRTFYELFADIEACLATAIELTLSCARERVVPAYDERLPWRARVRSALVALLSFLDEEPAMARLLIVESLGAGQQVLDRRTRTLQPLIAAIEQGRTEAKAHGAPALAAEAVVGGGLSLIHARIAASSREPLTEIVNQLMSMIVLPYQGLAAARRELERPLPLPLPRARESRQASGPSQDPFKAAGMRLTYRTARVLVAIAEQPGSSNTQVAKRAEVSDRAQISKLLARLRDLGLIVNSAGRVQGEANAWALTEQGHELHARVFLTRTGVK